MARKTNQNNSSKGKKVSRKPAKQEKSEDKKILVDGVVVENLQDTNYLVEIQMGEFKHKLTAYPAGKMRTYYRGRINLGDRVTVEIDPQYNIDLGRIVRKHRPERRTS